ncbi:VHS domain-containing protein At3g16270 [Selaginella moellendorffii]|nr:VHS domain-containing protein At3g16270 [Selaginella moellendorffii]|eukprot:XP_002981733.2 VHS domain-containing protein At3g16270 [Selaginella moellendorffii]
MESSRRAVEAYRRTRLIDGVTTDDDKVAPVYKLDEISSVLRSAPHDVVHEMVEYVFKRLEHKSPLVKQKTLRFIKFEVGKSGIEFKREIQRQSAAIRQLFHYQGQPDSLRGDSLNKAVRETAREAITAMFASDEKPPALEETGRRIEGFGNTNFDSRASQEKKTLLSEVVDIGTASIKQGLTMISSHYGHFGSSNGTKSKSSSGSYEAPNLRRSVSERDNFKYRDNHRDSYSYSESRDTYRETYRGGASEEMSYEQPDSPKSAADEKTEDANGLTQEEKLLDTVTGVGGVRLQPSREAIQSFLLAAQVLNPQRLHQAFEQKLQVHSWQVRLKTLCFLEAVLRQRAVKPFGDVSQRFEANHASVIDCMDSPQSSLREKANKVLGLLQTETEEGSQVSNDARSRQPKRTERVEMPDLIDTNDDDSSTHQKDEVDILSSLTEASPVQGDLLGDGLHENTETNGTSSLFEGLSIAEEPSKKPASATNISDLLGSLDTGTPSFQQQSNLDPGFGQDFSGLMGLEPQPQQQQQQQGLSRAPPSFVSPSIPGGAEFIMAKFDAARRFAPQAQAHYPGTAPPLYGFGQAPPAQQHSFQQQQDFSGGFGMGFGSQGASFASDAFDFSSHPYSSASASLPRMEETTKAFDFISDHMSAARTTKK